MKKYHYKYLKYKNKYLKYKNDILKGGVHNINYLNDYGIKIGISNDKLNELNNSCHKEDTTENTKHKVHALILYNGNDEDIEQFKNSRDVIDCEYNHNIATVPSFVSIKTLINYYLYYKDNTGDFKNKSYSEIINLFGNKHKRRCDIEFINKIFGDGHLSKTATDDEKYIIAPIYYKIDEKKFLDLQFILSETINKTEWKSIIASSDYNQIKDTIINVAKRGMREELFMKNSELDDYHGSVIYYNVNRNKKNGQITHHYYLIFSKKGTFDINNVYKIKDNICISDNENMFNKYKPFNLEMRDIQEIISRKRSRYHDQTIPSYDRKRSRNRYGSKRSISYHDSKKPKSYY